MASTSSDVWSILSWLETKVDLVCPLKAEVQTLRLKIRILKVFLSCRGKWHIDDGNLKAPLIGIQTVFRNADQDVRRLRANFIKISSRKDWCMPMNMDGLLSRMLENLDILKPDIKEVFAILSKSSRSITGSNDEAAMENLNSLLGYMEDLLRLKAEFVAPMKEALEDVQKRLTSFRIFLGFTAKKCSKLGKLKDLLIHSEVLTDNISCLLYLCTFTDNIDNLMVNEMKLQLSSQLQKFSPVQPDVREIYIKALKASKSPRGNSTVVDEFDLGFLDSLRDNMLELSDTRLSSMTPIKDQILSLYEELRFLTSFFAMGKHSKHDQMSNDLLKLITDVIIDIGCVIYSLYGDEQNKDNARELGIAVSDLQQIIKISKEDTRKAYDMYRPKSWPKFPRAKARGFIRSLLETLEELLKYEPNSIGPLKHQLEVVQYEILSLNEVFSKFTAKQLSQHAELEILRARFTDIACQTHYVITSYISGGRTLWSHRLGLFDVIEEVKMIKMELKDLPNKMTDETSVDKVSRKDNADEKKILEDVGKRGIEHQLRWLETNVDFICPLKNEVQTLRLKASFLKVFLSCKGKWHIEDGNLKVLLNRIHTMFQNADQDLQRLWADLIQISSKNMNMDGLLSSMVERLELLKPDIQEVYTILSKSSRFITGMSDKAVMGNLHSLQENMEDLLRCNAELVAPVKEELEAVQKRLKFLRNFVGFTAKGCSKLEDLLLHAQHVADNIACLLYLCSAKKKMDDQMVNEMKFQLSSQLQKFSPAEPDVRAIYMRALKASKSPQGNSTVVDEFDLGFLDSLRDNMLELSDTKLSSMAPIKDQILSLHEELRFLTSFIAMDTSSDEHIENDHIFKDLFERTSAVINEAGFIIFSLYDDEKNEEMDRELKLKMELSDLLAILMVAKEDARQMYDLSVPKSLRSNFPRTNGQGFIGSLLRNLKELLDAKTDLVGPLKHHIKVVQEELLSVSEDFSETAKQLSQFEELQNRWTWFIDTAYQAEYVIDSFMAGGRPLWCHKLGLFNVIEEIKMIKIELKAIKNKMTDDTPVLKPSSFPSQISLEADSLKSNAVLSSMERLEGERIPTKLVLFKKEAEEIGTQLRMTKGSEKLHILSIVGMPGIGKTTLVDSVFKDPSVTRHFHVLAKCSVSQVHDNRRLLLEILQEVTGKSNQHSDDDLDQKLYKNLKGRRYLIFMDDMWDIRPWEDIRASFPDDGNGSRIMFTSRLDNIASQAGPVTLNFRLSPLSEDKSWEMLQVKLFGNKSCPRKLERVGREIARNCKGLPLTIDLIAGVLRVTKIKKWKKVAENMMTLLVDDPQGRCRKVLELSYHSLPDDLKPCFLYFAAFPEDAEVPTRKLILLWIAEGFVKLQRDDHRGLEDAAEDNLNVLVSRSLVTVSERRPSGGVKASRVHDLLHEFALAKAKEESFMLKIDGNANLSTLSSDGYRWQKQYRLCIYPGNWMQFLKLNPSGHRVRSLLCSDSGVELNRGSLNFCCLNLLRVLNIPEVYCYYCPTMFTLIHLRFLAIRSSERKIFSKIHKLRNLETFIMDGNAYAEYLHLDKLCIMVNLRHFCFTGLISLIHGKGEIFHNLQTLFHLEASYDEDIEKILKLMPNLVKLKILFYNPDGETYPFPKLGFLMKLESLEVRHRYYDLPYPCKIISFPPNLRKLVLSNFRVPWSEISELENLDNLEILKLKNGAFWGPKWDMVDEQFPNLKYLSLSNLNIEEWNVSEDDLPCLEQLHLEHCKKLKELPYRLAEIPTLQVIKLADCSSSAKDSANTIKEEQNGNGNEQLVVDTDAPTYTVYV